MCGLGVERGALRVLGAGLRVRREGFWLGCAGGFEVFCPQFSADRTC